MSTTAAATAAPRSWPSWPSRILTFASSASAATSARPPLCRRGSTTVGERSLSSWTATCRTTRTISRVTRVPLHDFGCTLKAYRREVIQDVKLYGEMHRFIPVYASWVGARITELPVNHRQRVFGRSKYSLARTSRVLLDLITVKLLGSYSTKPIYFFGFAAFGLWALALVCAAIVIIQKLLPPYPYAHNNPLLLLAVFLGIVGVQFILMGLLAELSIRTYHESQGKAVYVVREVLEGGKGRSRSPLRPSPRRAEGVKATNGRTAAPRK